MPRKDKESFDVPPHTHCKVCGKPIPLGQTYCSRECMEKDLKEQKRANRMMTIYMVSIAAIFVVLLLISFRAK